MMSWIVRRGLPATRVAVRLGLISTIAWAAPGATVARADAAGSWAGGDPTRGEQIFAGNGCGWCHEDTGRKAGRGPQLMNTTRTDDFIANRIRHGFPGRMPGFGTSLKNDQIKDLVAFIHSIKPEGKQ
jgi:mono/diheme cytochrome c family protein